MTISERIFKILHDKNMSQSTFAKLTGLANSTISDWKTKKTNPSADKIMDICVVLDVTPEQLLTGKDIDEVCGEGCEKSTMPSETKIDAEIVKDIQSLKEEQQMRVLKYIQAMKQIDTLELDR